MNATWYKTRITQFHGGNKTWPKIGSTPFCGASQTRLFQLPAARHCLSMPAVANDVDYDPQAEKG